MRLRGLVAGFGLMSMVACSDSSEAGNAPGSGGSSSAGSGAGGGSSGSTASGGSSSGSGGGGGGSGNQGLACMEKTTNHSSGSRIKGRFLVTAEGDRAWEGWHDVELGIDCAVQGPFADGSYRCLPRTARYAYAFYADENCSDAIYDVSDGCMLETLVIADTTGCNPTTYRHLEIGELFTPEGMIYERSTDGSCRATSPRAGAEYHYPGAEIPSTQFAEVDFAEWPGAGRIGGYGYESSDGFHQLLGWYDSAIDRRCYFSRSAGGADRCMPISSAGNEFSDATCMTPLITRSGECPVEMPVYAAFYNRDRCVVTSTILRSEEEFTGTVHTGTAQNCSEATSESASNVHRYRTTALPDSDFAAAEITVVSSDPGRLKPRYRTTADGGCWFYDWWDSELETSCDVMYGSDGEQRCYPQGLTFSTVRLFTDSSCSGELVEYAYSTTPCSSAEAGKFVRLYDTQTCERPVAVRPILQTHTADSLPPLWTGTPENCSQFNPNPDYTFFSVGEWSDPSMFMGGTFVIE